jgi:hypothetical protein
LGEEGFRSFTVPLACLFFFSEEISERVPPEKQKGKHKTKVSAGERRKVLNKGERPKQTT